MRSPDARREDDASQSGGGTSLHEATWRLRAFRILFVALFVLVGVHVYGVLLSPDERFDIENKKHEGFIKIPTPRGAILDRNGLLLATDRPSPTLCANPRQIENPRDLSRALSSVLTLSEDDLMAKFTQRDAKGDLRASVVVKERLSDAEVATLRPMNLVDGLETAYKLTHGGVVEPAEGAGDDEGAAVNAQDKKNKGLRIEMQQVRFYPQGQLASHVIGFVKKDGVGGDGIELKYDSYLRSLPGARKARKDNQSTLLLSQTIEYKRPAGGDNVILTIDGALQEALERGLAEAVAENGAVGASGIMLDPKTGAILAMACSPSYDPNDYSRAPAGLRINRSAEFAFEPGSSFKIVTASAALEEKLITPDTVINCENGAFNPYGHTIKDVHKMGLEPFTMCFAESSNIAMIKVGAMLGPQRMESWIRSFGFGKRTCDDLRVETPGIFRERKKWSRLTMGSLPMGQEIAVSMLQLASAYSVIANGGYWVQPYVVECAESRDGALTYVHESNPPRRVLSEETAKTMQTLCHLVVTQGTGSKANIPEYRVGGKTGTAQIARPEGGFYADRYTAVFCGFAPLADPRICAAIVVHEPHKSIYGGQVAAPVFKKVVRDALISMHVPEDPVREPIKDGAPGIGADADTVVAKVETPSPEELAPVDDFLAPLDEFTLSASDVRSILGEPTFPDFSGMTKRQALQRLHALGIEADMTGSGWVVEQYPPAGTPLSQLKLCRLDFKNKSETPHAVEPAPDSRGM